jgi:hypothetical protein
MYRERSQISYIINYMKLLHCYFMAMFNGKELCDAITVLALPTPGVHTTRMGWNYKTI